MFLRTGLEGMESVRSQHSSIVAAPAFGCRSLYSSDSMSISKSLSRNIDANRSSVSGFAAALRCRLAAGAPSASAAAASASSSSLSAAETGAAVPPFFDNSRAAAAALTCRIVECSSRDNQRVGGWQSGAECSHHLMTCVTCIATTP